MSNLDAALSYLLNQTNDLPGDRGYQACLDVLVDAEFRAGSGSSSPSSHQHHVGRGGLVIHTAEVLRYALGIANTVDHENIGLDLDVLTVAAIFHDCMKAREYEEVEIHDGSSSFWKKTSYSKLIRHVCGSFAEWVASAKTYGYDQPFVDAVGHCILAHHGQIAWGSPVEPQTVEALILHQADMLSACYGRHKDA